MIIELMRNTYAVCEIFLRLDHRWKSTAHNVIWSISHQLRAMSVVVSSLIELNRTEAWYELTTVSQHFKKLQVYAVWDVGFLCVLSRKPFYRDITCRAFSFDTIFLGTKPLFPASIFLSEIHRAWTFSNTCKHLQLWWGLFRGPVW